MAELRGGRYEVLREIASGGMATVHLGRTLGVGGFERVVAIKVMHPHLSSDPQFIGMFLDEARLAARIRHPNVVGTLDVQEDERGLFLVMDYVEGPSLGHLVRAAKQKGAPPPLDVTLRIFLDLCAGLHAAHELTDGAGESLGLVHRDVSPQNVLVGTDGIARITDFGVARARSRITSTKGSEIKGKLAYLAPEQVLMQPIDRRCDVYAAGIVLWELLAGRRMSSADNDGALIAQLVNPDKPSPASVNPDVPAKLAEACMKALAFDVAERYASTAALAEALEEAALAEGVTIATPRAVSAFVKKLDAHLTVGPIPASGVTPATLGSSPSGLPLSLATPAEAPQTTTDAVVSARPPTSRAAIWAAVAILGLGLGVATAIRVFASPAAPASPAPSAALAAPAPSASSLASASPPVVTAASAPAPEASASASAIASASARPADARKGAAPGRGGNKASASPTSYVPSGL